jgi:hypothetical protein
LRRKAKVKVLIWGENRERVWSTANSARDCIEGCEIIIGTSDPFQQEARLLESYAGFCSFHFESGYEGKLDFIAKHAEDPFVFAMEGVLFNEGIKNHLIQFEGKMAFMNIAIDDGRFLSECNPMQGGFLEPTKEIKTSDKGGQSLICFISGGKLKFPTFFKGNHGEGLTLSMVNNSSIVDEYVRYIGNLDLQITQSGYYVLVMGLHATGLIEQHGDEVKSIVEEEVKERVFRKVERDINRLP